MKKSSLLAGILVFAVTAAAQAPSFLKGSFDEALAQAQKRGKLILVDFHQRGG